MKKKRLFSFVLAFLLVVSQPFIMVSSASNLASSETGNVGDADSFYTASGSVDGHVGLTAFLSSSGIYLSASADLSTFQDVRLSLDGLWAEFRKDVSGVTSNLAELGGSIVRGGLAFSRKSWNGYNKFANWLIDKFGIGDNQSDLGLGIAGNTGGLLYGTHSVNVGNGWLSGSSSNTDLNNINIRLYSSLQNLEGIVIFYVKHPLYGGYNLWAYNGSTSTFNNFMFEAFSSNNPNNIYTISDRSSSVVTPGTKRYINVRITSNLNPDLIVLTSDSDFVPPDNEGTDFGLNVSTDTIDVPDEISDSADGGDKMGGLLLPAVGAGLGSAAGAIAGNIMQGVLDGALPDIDIKPADVKVPPGMDIDDDGNIFPSDVEFRPTDVFLDSDAYKLDMLTNYFPFSIPWDLLQFAAMFRAEPEVPVMEFVLPMPEGIDDIVINVDLTPFEPVAALSRSGLFVLFAIRWLMFLYRKFG